MVLDQELTGQPVEIPVAASDQEFTAASQLVKSLSWRNRRRFMVNNTDIASAAQIMVLKESILILT